jgi:hypothetical protein
VGPTHALFSVSNKTNGINKIQNISLEFIKEKYVLVLFIVNLVNELKIGKRYVINEVNNNV